MTEKELIASEIHHLITGCVSNYTKENKHAHILLQKVLDFIAKMPPNDEIEGEFLYNPYPTICLDDCKDYDFKDGDKVRIIIVKE